MSYAARPKPATLSGIASTIVDTVGSVVVTAASIVADPYFPEIVCRVSQIAAVEGKRPPPACATTPNYASTVGLKKAMTPLRAYAYAETHPWVYPVSIAAVVGIPFLLGYLVAKR